MELVSCDTFAVLPDKTADGAIIFGKNSDRPKGEVQEVIFSPSKSHLQDQEIQCTYIKVASAPAGRSLACYLSRPAWMWGAEMGANEAGVVAGNEAVWTAAFDEESALQPRLLGMDLLR